MSERHERGGRRSAGSGVAGKQGSKKKRVQKGARGAAQQPKRVALHNRRLHARKQTVLGRKKSKLHAVFARASMHAMTVINQRRRARQNR